MPTRTANAQWDGTLTEGNGTMEFGSGAWSGQYSFSSRFEEGPGTSPEELTAAAHSGCFSMAFSLALEEAGHDPQSVSTSADVHLTPKDGGGFEISRIDLHTRATVPGIDEEEFARVAEDAKRGCPVSVALGGVGEITVDAQREG